MRFQLRIRLIFSLKNKSSKPTSTVRLGQVEIAASGPQIGTAGGGLLNVGYFQCLGHLKSYALGTSQSLGLHQPWFYLGAGFFKGGQFCGSFDPNRLKSINSLKKKKSFAHARRRFFFIFLFFDLFLVSYPFYT